MKYAYRIVLSVSLLIALFFSTDHLALVHAAASADLSLVLAALVVMTCARVLMPVKWNILLCQQGLHLPWAGAIRLYYAAALFGQLLPATIGADMVRLGWLSRHYGQTPRYLASIIVERCIGLLVLCVLAVIGAFLLVHHADELRWSLLAGSAKALAAGGVLILILLAGFRVVRGKDLPHLAGVERVAQAVRTCGSSLHCYAKQRRVLVLVTALTGVEACVTFLAAYLVMRALALPIEPVSAFAFLPLQFLLLRLPLSVNGWGVHEAGFVYFLGLYGVAQPAALAAGLLHHVLQLVALAPGAFMVAGWLRNSYSPFPKERYV